MFQPSETLIFMILGPGRGFRNYRIQNGATGIRRDVRRLG